MEDAGELFNQMVMGLRPDVMIGWLQSVTRCMHLCGSDMCPLLWRGTWQGKSSALHDADCVNPWEACWRAGEVSATNPLSRPIVEQGIEVHTIGDQIVNSLRHGKLLYRKVTPNWVIKVFSPGLVYVLD
ncbi:hypothetical protein QJS04_geneDACA020483 [Acorus gramineus]|uniref:Uncharacterized protein n=1 Tax=Acorus gramineus TaxID=55184 RepID=A0AAV9ADW5_ACOGR|nr:hypothetical protein QJS04_geneDACA020483 [Acorus gramineus]